MKDRYRPCELKDVRLEGFAGAKMDRFLNFRVLSDFAKREIFGEAREPLKLRDDDANLPAGGMWRGEFWGKLMLSAARVADYTQDKALLNFIQAECHRVMEFQDEDGYLGSYAEKTRVCFDEASIKTAYDTIGWPSLWNIWNRKYLIWSMLMVAKVIGDKEILDSVCRQADQLINMMHALGTPLCVTGEPHFMGAPSMSILKPIVMLYEETGNEKYLDFAKEIVPDWDRDDGKCINFFTNAFNGKEFAKWYPNAYNWAKSYELMSCMDGILEYYRVTGEKLCLDAIAAIYENLATSELNPLGDVGFVDKLIGSAHYPNAATEVCDAIHWIRLSYDLFLITGEDKYLDYMELAYFNAFLAGVYRDGTWTAFTVRASTHHEANSQCNCAFNHCCVNNAPRTFMDIATATVTKDNDGVFQVNFYQDATATLNGVTFIIRGNYPIGNTITVSVSDPTAKIRFRKPTWCRKLDVTQTEGIYTLAFDMNPRIVNRCDENIAEDANSRDAWPYNRYLQNTLSDEAPLVMHYRSTMAATMMYGPLVLARARQAGARQDELYDDDTVNNQGCTLKLTPKPPANCWGIWQAEIFKGDNLLKSFPVCDLQSAADFSLYGYYADTFSIWV